MEDGHEEEAQHEAMPPSPTQGHPDPQAALSPGKRWESTHRHNILYPLASYLMSVGTVCESRRNLTSSRSKFSSEAGHGAKVQPSERFRSVGGKSNKREKYGDSEQNTLNAEIAAATEPTVRAEMQTFPLRFRDSTQEDAFCKHFNVYVTNKMRVASQLVILINVIMVVAQFLTQRRVLNNFVFVSRIAIITLSLIFQVVTLTSWFRRKFDQYLLGYYMILNFVHQLPRFIFLMYSVEEEEKLTNHIGEISLFASQKSVRAMNLVFIVIIYVASGMRFTAASICACWHMLARGIFVIAFCHECTWDDVGATNNLTMIAFCTLTAFHSERYVRQEFLERLIVDEERKRRDNLLETMLPAHIKERLKDNSTDGFAESYDEVSILFCYVSNFQALSKHTSAIDLVQLMNRIVFCFDLATDAHGVYKVEAIAETYMCAAGVPQRDPFHCEKVAEMALTMMRTCEKESWSFNGVDIQLQIGIHSGPVVAGVVGNKTYSYHLFGDTVNTSSRVCSSGYAGKIQISDRSRQLLERTGAFVISERGTVNLKGKGMVQLYWLEGKSPTPFRGYQKFACTDVFGTIESAVEESIRAKDLAYKSPLHHRSDDYLGYMNAVEIRRLTLDFRREQAISCPTKYLKFPAKTARVQAAPDSIFTSKVTDEGNSPKDRQSIQIVKDTASEMERGFRTEHNRDSTPQFCASLYMCVIYLVVIIIYRAYRIDNGPNKATRNAKAYSILGVTIFILLVIVQLLRRYPRLARLKERWGTGTGLVFVLVFNIQMLTANGVDSLKDSQPRGKQKITFLDGNLLLAVVVGLVMRLRFRNAVVVNAWGFTVFVVCMSLRRAESWTDLSESFYLLLVVSWISVHFGYKRELGLRHDFLLKCTLQLEKQKCEDLLTNMLPSKQYADALMQQSTIVDELAEVTLLYSDMVGFTPLGAKLDPTAICVMLHQIYSAFDSHLDDLGVYKLDTIGDAFIVVGGLPGHKSIKNHAAAIAAFAVEMLHEIDRFCAEANVELQMRIGIHTGNVVGGVVGIKKHRYLIWGRHTVIANLMESQGVAGRIQISETAYAHLQECPEFRIEERTGQVQISDNESIRTYFLEPGHPVVKDAVIDRYLHKVRRVRSADVFALDQLRTCLLPSTNSPLSKHLEVPTA